MKVANAVVKILKLKSKDDGHIEFGIKHPCEHTYMVPNQDSYCELTKSELEEIFTIIEGDSVDLQAILKKSFVMT